MTVVCFTGKADILGNKVDRHHLEAACRHLRWETTEKPSRMFDDGILVASRTGTAKDKAARDAGWTVMTYDEFAGHLHMNGINEVGGVRLDGLSHSGQRRREQEEAKKRVAEKREQRKRELEALEQNELWGAWG